MLSIFLLLMNDSQSESKFERLHEKYRERVFAIAFSYTNNHHDSEEITQTTFFKLSRNLHKVDEENVSLTKSYIYTIAKNTAFTFLKKRCPNYIPADEDRLEAKNSYTADYLLAKETTEMILKCIKELPELYRDSIKLRYLSDFSIKEIAQMLDLNESTIKTHLLRGRKILANKLRRERIIRYE